ncbi:probable leucine-rich repeat receptor-like protein kinase At1g35710 [Chenopodium quinoa]|uniref:probable leucine-rich repeat receptor-like protein kinase At1g35710 n=1 Tax=Chenopodium quinoa TaxID=63459 RepID=UPI000B7850DC|nr:probable leucine-rich repeat receptor-like protein kinase At1g35710 [Chenopodium quinoa]
MQSLSYLDLSRNNLQGAIPTSFGNMHDLSYLDLSHNKLQGIIPASFGNMKSLSYLKLGFNQLESSIPNIKHLTYLDLSSNNFKLLSSSLGNLCSLQKLDVILNNLTQELGDIIQTLNGCTKKSLLILWLESNQIWGPIPDTIDTFSSLQELYLYNNRLNGTITQRLRNMTMLETLDLSSNSLKGTLSNNHFSNLSRLKNLDLSNNSALVLNMDDNLVPPFQFDTIYLGSCRLGPMFPKWLQKQTKYSWLDISGAGISDSIPNSFWKSLPPNLVNLNISHNNIYGTLPDLQIIVPSTSSQFFDIDMSFNHFKGKIPSFPKHVTSVYLSSNKFSNHFPFLCPKSKTNIHNLDLSNNLLSGELLDCWMNFDQLLFLNLENNKFSASIPSSFGYLNKLQSLHLANNMFSKDFPRSMMNCTSLINLNLGHNLLSGHVTK